MKHLFMAFLIALTALMTACGGSHYDQELVDNTIQNAKVGKYTDEDYKILIQQANYAIDDIENADDFSQWSKENEKELQTLVILMTAMEIKARIGQIPESVEPDFDKLSERFKKVSKDVLNNLPGFGK